MAPEDHVDADGVIEGEIVSRETALELRRTHDVAPATLFGTDEPAEVVARATKVADALAGVIRSKRLSKRISGHDYVFVEGWTLAGAMLGVFPVTEWTRPVMRDGRQVGWEARVEVRMKDGNVIGAAEAECLRAESKWANADDYSIRSMAQTRATSKAMRQPLGFVMTLAGYEPTPADEINETIVAQPARQKTPLPEDLVTKLRTESARLTGVPAWSEQEILVSASQSFGRKVERLEQLTVDEAKQILTVAKEVPTPPLNTAPQEEA